MKKYGEAAELDTAEYAKGDVISVARSRDGGVVRVNISAASVSGAVTYFSGEGKIMTIDGTEYKLSDNFREIGGRVTGGSEVTAYTDVNGRAFAAEILGGFEYMYLANCADRDIFGGSVTLRLINTSGEVCECEADAGTRYGGGKNRVSDIAKLEPQLLRVRRSPEGKLFAVETAADMVGAVGADEFSLSFSSDSCKYYGGVMCVFASKYQLGSATPVFFVPKDISDIKRYDTADRSRLYSDYDYKVRLYDVSDEYTASAAVIYMDGSHEREVEPYDEVGIIRDSAQINNAEGEPCLKLSVYIRGEEREIYFDNDGGNDMTPGWLPGYTPRDTANGNNPFKRGEVIQYYSDSESHCRSFRMLLTRDLIGGSQLYEKNTGDYGALSEENYFSELYSAYGAVQGRFADKILIAADGDGKRLRTIPLGGAGIYVYDTKRNTLLKGDASDIERGSLVFVRMSYADTVDILAVR